jgi:multisubunit Na+/H+ antiporter MnhC subunit
LDVLEWSWWRFWWGALGAVAPEIIRLYKTVTNPAATPLTPQKFSLTYIVVSLAFVALGGALAVAWNDETAIKCIAVGAATPLIISGFALKLPPHR